MTDRASRPEWLTAEEAAGYLKVKTRSLLLWVRQGKLQAYALTGTKRRIWRFRKEDLDSALLSKPVISCESLPVRSGKGANN
ncbi:MAG: helix-turn-helix domain-containing protein [Terriglobia bacterium]|jgi:excisionase family DNA binding protein